MKLERTDLGRFLVLAMSNSLTPPPIQSLSIPLYVVSRMKILSIAVHDLGQYVRFYPRGKTLVESLGAKVAIVNMMEHPDPAVRYEALVATQKILTQNW